MTSNSYSDDQWAVGRGHANWMNHGDYDVCDVITPHGIVTVYRQGWGDGHTKHVRLDFARNGEWYMRSYVHLYSRQYAVTLARRFAKEKSR